MRIRRPNVFALFAALFLLASPSLVTAQEGQEAPAEQAEEAEETTEEGDDRAEDDGEKADEEEAEEEEAEDEAEEAADEVQEEAEQTAQPGNEQSGEQSGDAQTQDAQTAQQAAAAAEGDGAEEADEEGEEEEGDEAARETEHGTYEWKPSYGGGLEGGVWFTNLDRWNSYVLDESGNPLEQSTTRDAVDTSTVWHGDLVVEASLLEGTRLSLFGGIATPFGNDPSVSARYIGLEPAFAFRRDMWEIAIGLGAGIGGTTLSYEDGAEMNANLVLLRPFLEVRGYLNTWSAVYGRFGFNQWLVSNPEFEGDLSLLESAGTPVDDVNLHEGGPFLALGVRFGHYPEHVKHVDDTDDDGLRDDVDDCPEQPEDFDDYQDDDGCPDNDNDGDGIADDQDQCPERPEDADGWQDEDGCPETDDDTDGDGILNADDQCPEKPEDFDGFQDEDGCPDPDNDGDGILDKEDKCPDRAGVPEKQGCPLQRVEVTLKKIVINEKVFFEYNKAVIKPESYDLLNEVAQVIKDNPRIKKIEVQGHTDHQGSESYNMKLSEDRAKAVHEYLLGQGVKAERLTFKGYGFSEPLVPLGEDGRETEEAAARNRRVEFVILEQDEVKKTVREDQVPEDAEEVQPVEE